MPSNGSRRSSHRGWRDSQGDKMSDTDAVRRMLMAVERLEASADTQVQQARDVAKGLQQVQAAQV